MFSRSITPLRRTAIALACAVVATGCESGTAPQSAHPDLVVPSDAASQSKKPSSSFPLTPTVYATGLQYPRGLKFGPDGALYVAEAGTAGTGFTTPSQCTQVAPPVGPYLSGSTGRISRIAGDRVRHTFASGFPSGINAFGDVLGVADVAFTGTRMYALSSGGGCSHGTPTSPAGIARVSSSGAWSIVDNLSAWQATHPVAHPNPGDFEPDGSWYSLIASGGSLVAVEPNHGDVVHADPVSGLVSRIVDMSALFGHVVPTVVAERKGALYVSNLGTFPSVHGAESIYRISPTGATSVVATGFTEVLGLVFDHSGRLYVLESSTASGFPTPTTGDVVRIDRKGNRTVIVNNLFLPTGITIGTEGSLYISNHGFGPPNLGEILRVDLRDDGDDDDDIESGN